MCLLCGLLEYSGRDFAFTPVEQEPKTIVNKLPREPHPPIQLPESTKARCTSDAVGSVREASSQYTLAVRPNSVISKTVHTQITTIQDNYMFQGGH